MKKLIIGSFIGILLIMTPACHKDGKSTLEYRVSISMAMWDRGKDIYYTPVSGDTIELIANIQSGLYVDERAERTLLVFDGSDWVLKDSGKPGPFPIRITVLESQRNWIVLIRAIYYRGEELITVNGIPFRVEDGNQSVVFFRKP